MHVVAAASSEPTSYRPVPHVLSARRLHELAVESFRIGNRGRLSLCDAFRALSETRLYFDLGFPSLAAYANTHFQLCRSETFEYVRVAQALVELTTLRSEFAAGRMSWAAIKAITRVAGSEDQTDWIELARKQGIERTLAEARDALRRGAHSPRKGSFGLPNLDQKLVLRFSRSDMERVRAWLDGASALVAEKSGAGSVSAEQALLFLCEQSRARPKGEPATGETSRSVLDRRSDTQIVYQRCSECRRSALMTGEGPVEVTPAEVERHEGCAETVVIDGPTPPALRRRILAREGGRCGNPRCHHRADHCHHVVFRSHGGETSLANEVAVCAACHALVHAGLLRVTGVADGEVIWTPGVPCDSNEDAGGVADRLPILHVAGASNGYRNHGEVHASASADSNRDSASLASNDDLAGVRVEDLAGGLVRLGFGRSESLRRVIEAARSLPHDGRTEAAVLRRALSSKPAGGEPAHA